MSDVFPQPVEGLRPLLYIVDDNEFLGEVTRQLLESVGYTTKLFNQGLPARADLLSTATPPVVLVTDFDIGDINGLDLIGDVRPKLPRMKCLLVSGTAKPEALERHPVKPDLFVRKPFRADELLAAVNTLVAQARAAV